jgi:hypothetical protein
LQFGGWLCGWCRDPVPIWLGVNPSFCSRYDFGQIGREDEGGVG